MATTPVTPEPQPPAAPEVQAAAPEPQIDISMPAAEIKSRILEAEQQTRETEKVFEPFTINHREDGTWLVNYATGELFKGSDADVIRELAKARHHTREYADRLKAEVQQHKESAQPQPSAPEVQPQPAMSDGTVMPQDDDAFAAEYLNNLFSTRPDLAQQAVSRALGIPPEQLAPVMGQVFHNAVQNQVRNTEIEFLSECPDFFPSEENFVHLLSYFPSNLNRTPTVEELRFAHARALYDKKYAPAHQPGPPPQRPTPPPMLHTGAPRPSEPDADLYQMPLAELKALIQRGGR